MKEKLSFSDKQILIEIMARFALQEIVKGLLRAEMNPHKDIKSAGKDNYTGKYKRQHKCIFCL